jgi:hypothetical protein
MTETVLVRFEGQGTGVAELSWGQREIWAVMRQKGHWLSVGGVRQLPPGRTVQDVAEDLRYAMSRHQALRTRLRFTAGGAPLQVVADRGEIALEVVEADGDDPAEVAAAVADRFRATYFDYEADWPARMAVITADGTATHVAEVFCHLAADGFGLALLRNDMDMRQSSRGQAPPVTALQPLEQAAKQRGPAARRAHDAAMRYTERLLTARPPARFPESGDQRSPRAWLLTCTSTAGYRALRALAAREGVSTSPVLLAAFAVAVTELTGVSPVAVQLVVNNRFRPGLGASVSTVMQSCPCVIDPADGFREVIGRAFQAAMSAYKNSYYDLDGKNELTARIGPELSPDCLFNDRRVDSRETADVPGGDASDGASLAWLRAQMQRTTLTWDGGHDSPIEKLSLNIDDAPAGALRFQLEADTRYASPATMEALVRRIESVLVEAAAGVAAC